MKIQPYQSLNAYKAPIQENKQQAVNQIAPKQDTYVPGERHQEITYSNKVFEKHENTIKRLREESEATYNSLRQLVLELLQRQGHTVEKGKIPQGEIVKVDEIARNEAAAQISENGPLGAEKVSERIVNFAIAISGGDKSKLDLLKGAIQEGFDQVQNMLGELPEVSVKTYDLIMEKLDKWEKGQ